jgi:hypothetical protein
MGATNFEMDVASGAGTVRMTETGEHICFPAYLICQPSAWLQNETVVDMCYSTNIVGVRVTNPTSNSWAGAIQHSSDGGANYSNMECRSCTGGTVLTASIVVDGGTGGAAQATTQCLGGATCDLIAAAGWCGGDTRTCAILPTAVRHSILVSTGHLSRRRHRLCHRPRLRVSSPPRRACSLRCTRGTPTRLLVWPRTGR